MSKRSAPPSVDELKRVLHDAQLRSTPARLAVLRVLTEAESPVSHGDVAERLSDGTYDRVTLFRVLNDLSEAGLATRSDVDHVWRFELTAGAHGKEEGHPHFVCVSCGRVLCLPGARVDLSRSTTRVMPLETGRFQVQLKGRCESCAAA